MHPLDRKGKTPLNLERGGFSNPGTRGSSVEVIPVAAGEEWDGMKSGAGESLSGGLVATAPPTRVSRSVVEGKSGTPGVSLDGHSTISYDPVEHRFVNTNSPAAPSPSNGSEVRVENGRTAGPSSAPTVVMPPRTVAPPVTRSVSAPPARNIVPPPAPRYSGGERGSSSAGSRGESWGGHASSRRTTPGPSSSP